MTSRHRVQSTKFPSGGTDQSYVNGSLGGTDTNSWNGHSYWAECFDTTGSAGQDHNLFIEKWFTQFEPLNGTLEDGIFKHVYTNFLPVQMVLEYTPSGLPPSPDPEEDATTVLARTNPNRYSVDMLQNLVDIRDLPKLVQLAGDTILKRGAGAYLNWQFGWKPLISDLKKMLDFTGLVNKKVNELHKLYQAGGLHRKVRIRTENIEFASNFVMAGIGSHEVAIRKTEAITRERWGSVRYLPSTLPPKDESDYRRLAIRIVYGLELSPKSVWEALPWTWLIDWFSNTGDFLSQYNNIVPVAASRPCIMTKTTSRMLFARVDTTGGGVSGGTLDRTYQTKQRVVCSPTLTASLPFLSQRQLSILGALFITKHRAR